jgi:L-ribulokinase
MEHGVPIERVIHGGGIPQKNEVLNQIYANIFNKPVLVPTGDITGLGSAIFASLAAGIFKSVEEAQKNLCPPYRTVSPQTKAVAIYEELFPLWRKLYFAMGNPNSEAISIGNVLPTLQKLSA